MAFRTMINLILNTVCKNAQNLMTEILFYFCQNNPESFTNRYEFS